MKPAEESLLGAYVDGELDAAACAVVEAAARENAAIADRLAELSRVRDLVAALPREPLMVDLSAAVVARIAVERAGRIRRARHLLIASCTLAAASLLLATTIDRPGVAPRPPEVAKSPARRLLPPPALPAQVVRMRPTPALNPASTAIGSELLATEQQSLRDRRELGDLMGDAGAREILVEVDDLDGPTLDKVEDAIRRSNRREPKHAHLRLDQEVVNDPRRPRRAVAYVLVMDDAEKTHFGRNLEESLQGAASVEGPADAGRLALLPRADRVEIRGGVPRATLLPPPVHLAKHDAFREADAGPPEADAPHHPVAPEVARAPSVAGAAKESPPGVYVVWVTAREGPRARPN